MRDRDLEHKFELAAMDGDLSIVTECLQKGVSVHVNRDRALQYAATYGNVDVVDFLIRSGADVFEHNDLALRQAAEGGHLAVVNRLLDAGSDVAAKDNAAFQWAVEGMNGADNEVMDRLVIAGADLTSLFSTDTSESLRKLIIQRYAASAHRGYEAVMMLRPTPRLAVLRHLHPELKPKQIRDEMAMMDALGLSIAQMGEMWKEKHGTPAQQQEVEVVP